ncbi:Phospholipase/carboxylesterase [Microstroma glucosiphilum]|uniref:Acyl-protein thioesterase 1 n=1 Tax=Pseudomicrostroma glucosiphilum TaxID=1684307 RepID=A0A316TYU3_9BASI|nr:Phospholipase/carboxylesterase [Pseudomicrostroma glucosiphilum]PWN17878.1 Phospholipase/carboxylesterase [Pseudomicrostroma glucosiphilum]
MASPLLKTLVVPAASGTATASVIFAHGLGDSGLGWLDVAKMLSRRPSLNHVRFILPNAPVQPVSLNMGMPMPSWFDITTLEDISEAEDERGLLKSSSEINRLIQAEIDGSAEGLGGKGIEAGRVVVGGFSQGGAIAYLTGLTHPTPLAGIIALSSWLPLKSKIVSLLSPHAKDTPVFHGHGSSDQIVQFTFGKRTVEFLKSEAEGGLGMGEFKTASGAGRQAKGVKFEIYRGMAHSACPEEIEHVGQFLESIVPKH